MECSPRFVTMCYALAAVSAAAEGDIVDTFMDSSLAIASGTCNPDVSYAGYSLAAVVLAVQGRLIGTAGFVAKTFGRHEIANSLLAFHYGLMSFDAADQPAAARIAHGALSATYATL